MVYVTDISSTMAVNNIGTFRDGLKHCYDETTSIREKNENILKWYRSTEEAAMFILGNSRMDSSTAMGADKPIN